jgi:hypothetical protein
LTRCKFVRCGIIDNNANTIDADKNLNVSACTFVGSLNTNPMDVRCTTAPDAGKVRQLIGNAFDKAPIISEMRAGVVRGNYFAVHPTPGSATYRPATWEHNFVHITAGVISPAPAIVNDYRYNATEDNAHFLAAPDYDQVYDGVIMESAVDWVVNEGDGVIRASEPTAPRTWTVQNCLTLPSPGGLCSCTLFTAACNTNAVWRVKNNTLFAGDRGRGYIGVHEIGQAGMVDYFKNNLGWAALGDATATLLESDPLIAIAADYVTTCDYNGYWHMATAYDVDARRG